MGKHHSHSTLPGSLLECCKTSRSWLNTNGTVCTINVGQNQSSLGLGPASLLLHLESMHDKCIACPLLLSQGFTMSNENDRLSRLAALLASAYALRANSGMILHG